MLLSALLFAVCCILPSLLHAQVDTAWVRRYNGPGNYWDMAFSFAIDGQGNLYVTGSSYGSGTSGDYATIKYNSAGETLWVRRYSGPGNYDDYAYALAIDGYGNVYVTGSSYGSGTFEDFTTIKYNSAGETLWVRSYNGPADSTNRACAIALDHSGNIYVSGSSVGSGTFEDFATIKYNSAGVEQWVQRYNKPGNYEDKVCGIALDSSGNIYVSGSSVFFMYSEYVTIKYNSAGVEQWVAIYHIPGNITDEANAIAVDAQGNVYVTGASCGSGTSNDYTTIKYNSAGQEQWVQRYNNGYDVANAIAVDPSGNVYVTGESEGSGTGFDYATVKYDTSGVQEWVARYNGSGNSYDHAYSLTIDEMGSVYVTGKSYGGSGFSCDYTTIKYNSTGQEQWVQRYNGPGNEWDVANAIALDSSGNVYVTGGSCGSGTDYDYTTIKYVQMGAIEEDEIASHSLAMTNVKVYPNPARTYFTIHLLQTTDHIKIFDVSGKAVKELESFGVGELRVSLDGIKNGVYFVKVNNNPQVTKIIVTK